MANVVNNLGSGQTAIHVLPSAARTANPDTMEYRDVGHASGIVVVVDATAIAATPALTVKIQGVDLQTDKTWDILTSASIATVSTTILKVRPGITAAANVAVSDVLPPNIRITATHGDADSITYSINAYLVY